MEANKVSGAVKAVVLAFVVGGCFSVVGQLLLMASAALLGSDSALVGPLTLVLVGLLGLLLFLPGWYQKLMNVGGFGTIMPFCGLACACAGEYLQATAEGGSVGKGAWAAFKLLIYVAGVGIVFALCFALIYVFAVTPAV